MALVYNRIAQAIRPTSPTSWRGKAFHDFNIRPISQQWRSYNDNVDRKPAYRSAVANVAYIWRQSDAVDAMGRMPASFERRRFELVSSGLLLPAKAPNWACEGYTIWQEADGATLSTGDQTAVSAWHVIATLPAELRGFWTKVVTDFAETHLVSKGAAVAYAIHACPGEEGEVNVHPHSHLVVTARHWRHDRRHGRIHPHWLGNAGQHCSLRSRWREFMASLSAPCQ
ncbi:MULTISPECIES: MobA/MobL family protein [unclassified Sphingobium]|uniref:MobA/MobL family protein n=1 Tax=unclassified Sphingobium TaxID=2611147 RepID=UPI0022253E22|nr:MULTISPECIES: MobA/MobL family protein [unclassified Sphingobium]MCW2411807.1 hypothetical protein [Sphingobium sp. B8D3D]MCW2415895.1 hypothetical protein [Sphingobium sp. B8D3A]